MTTRQSQRKQATEQPAMRPTRSTLKLAPKQGALDRYLSDMQRFPLMNAKQEQALAKEIAELNLARYEALFSYRPAIELVAEVLEAHLESVSTALSALKRAARKTRGRSALRLQWEQAVEKAAGAVAALDTDGVALTAAAATAEAALRSDGRARRYLARLATSRRAHKEASERFVNCNLRLVISIAQRYDRGQLPLSDLIQEGNIGLIRAVDRFDHSRGYRFSTYATWWIRHFVTRALADKARLVRIPVHTLDAISKLTKADNAAAGKTGEAPSDEQLAELTGLAPDKVGALKQHRMTQRPIWLDRAFGEDQDQSLHDILPAPMEHEPEEELDHARWREELKRLMHDLPPKEAAILRFRFGLDGEELTLREIGDKYHLSRERIRQLQERALGNLRAAIAASGRAHGGDGRDAA